MNHPQYITNECLTTVKGTVSAAFRHRAMLHKIPLPVRMNTTRITWDVGGNRVESLIQDNNKDTIEKTYVSVHLN